MVLTVLRYLLAAILLLSAVGHIFAADFYAEMIPEFIPATLANVLAAIVEAVVGFALLLKPYVRWGGLGFMLLMIAFLPIHGWDMLKEEPAIGPPAAAVTRFCIQFILIYAGWWIWRKARFQTA